MGNWKTTLKVSDLSENEKLEMLCLKCDRVTYTNREMICHAADRSQLYLDEVESKARCRARGCKGRMRMSKVRLSEMSGFVGGLA